MLEHRLFAKHVAVHWRCLVGDADVGDSDYDPLLAVEQRVAQRKAHAREGLAAPGWHGPTKEPRRHLGRSEAVAIDLRPHHVYGRARRSQKGVVRLKTLPEHVQCFLLGRRHGLKVGAVSR